MVMNPIQRICLSFTKLSARLPEYLYLKALVVIGLAWAMVISLSGCAQYPLNSKIEDVRLIQADSENFRKPLQESQDILMMLAFSSGGTRASALSYGVLKSLAKISLPNKQPSDSSRNIPARRMLDEVDFISSVSGGSFTSAYYGLYGDRIFMDFKERFLKRDINVGLIMRFFSTLSIGS